MLDVGFAGEKGESETYKERFVDFFVNLCEMWKYWYIYISVAYNFLNTTKRKTYYR
ncbi:hypothetical protein Cpar_0667 [Chlorobaculum parvum NCIB 8327]|uniref:Uncharacterized protein n=1 Tax=Chlorobaculum parvum (strain DSM 263 / NCIMB 8327) TaxID=517417 RepID=B3QMD4_CHLP8|nr:hypothetical protein Cpar_0667 [Chlorobaculum parvum NCIB 8327]